MHPNADRSLSILVMTYNEEVNIERCLASVKGIGEEILVLDSFSTDQTVAIAQRMGARVEKHPFDAYAEQRRRLVKLAGHDWIFMLDADEYVSDELRASVLKARQENNFDAYTSNRRNRIGTTWLRHGSWYPDKNIRMFDRRKFVVSGDDIHETLVPVSPVRIGHLEGDLMHDPGQSIENRMNKINAYSSRAAASLFKNNRATNWLAILFKPVLRFISVYFIRLGILDGFYGYVIAKSEAQYVWMREVKLMELWKSRGHRA